MEVQLFVFFMVVFVSLAILILSQFVLYFIPAKLRWLRIIFSGRILLVVLGLAFINPIYLLGIPLYLLVGGFFVLLALWRGFRWSELQQTVTIIPEYRLSGDLHFYEVGAIVDGNVSTTDLIAQYIFRRLNPVNQLDPVEVELERILKLTGGIERYTQQVAKVETRERVTANTYSYSFSYVDYSGAAKEVVTKQLVRDGYFRYSPAKIEWRVSLWATTILFLAMFAGLSLSVNSINNILTVLIILGALIATIPVYLAASFSWYFHENFDRLIPARRELLGHKMYLQTAEYHRITSDKDLFRSLIPYFVAYGIRPELVKQGIAEFGLFNEVVRS